MTVTVPVLGIIIVIFLLHTVVTHLINWAWRKAWEEDTGLTVIVFLLSGFELILSILLLDYCLK
jgi:hypothetical protein